MNLEYTKLSSDFFHYWPVARFQFCSKHLIHFLVASLRWMNSQKERSGHLPFHRLSFGNKIKGWRHGSRDTGMDKGMKEPPGGSLPLGEHLESSVLLRFHSVLWGWYQGFCGDPDHGLEYVARDSGCAMVYPWHFMSGQAQDKAVEEAIESIRVQGWG